MRVSGGSSPAVRAVVVTAATSLLMVLVAWATLIGPDEVFTGPGPTPATRTTPTESCIPLPVSTAPDGTVTVEEPDDLAERNYCEPPDTTRQDARDLVEQSDPPLWLKLLVWTFLLAVAATMLGLVVYLLVVARGSFTRRPSDRRDAVEFTALSEPAQLVEAITGDAAEQDHVLRDGDPRNAIVAAWLRFEVQGESAGVGRRSWETSSEYAIRILDLVSADAGAVNRLAGLYREARFSRHAITEDHRSEALDALATIRRSLVVRT